jgi:hypothetical protein
MELRPLRRVRIVDAWLTDRLHTTGSSDSNNILTSAGASQSLAALLTSRLVTNYNQNEIEVYFEPFSRVTLRGGYRYVWGDANQVTLPPAGLSSSIAGTLRRNVGLGGVTYRASQKLSLLAEAEVASGDGSYFRTSLYNYQRVRAQARYQATKSLGFSGDFSALINDNPLAGPGYSYSSVQESASLMWTPKKLWDFQGTYSRYDLKADIGYLAPQDLAPMMDRYRERANSVSALFNLNSPERVFAPKFTAGGSFFMSSGSRPTNYFQPLARVSIPAGKHVMWFAEWRYYGYGELFYLFEGFRAHLVTTGLRFSR